MNRLAALTTTVLSLSGLGCLPGREVLPRPVAVPPAVTNAPPPRGAAPAPRVSLDSPPPRVQPNAQQGPLPEPAARADAATAYAQMNRDACEGELRRRGVAFESAESASGVDHPIRLRGPLHGVEIHEPGARAQSSNWVHAILDCRLALSLDDFTAQLASRDITEIVHMSLYRKGAIIAGRKTPSQHAFGRAIDIAAFIKRDGTRLDVLRDWGGRIGDPVCGPLAAAPRAPSAAASELRSIVCDAASRGTFHLVLTPNFNRDHENHLHIDIEPKRERADVK